MIARAALPLALFLSACAVGNVEGPKAYRVWCNHEKRFLSDWLTDRAEAERVRDEHLRREPWHPVTIHVAAQEDVRDRLRE